MLTLPNSAISYEMPVLVSRESNPDVLHRDVHKTCLASRAIISSNVGVCKCVSHTHKMTSCI